MTFSLTIGPLDPSAKLWHSQDDCQPGGSGMPEFLNIAVADHIGAVVMNRPPVNAQLTPFREGMIAVFDGFTDRDDVGAVGVTFSRLDLLSDLPQT